MSRTVETANDFCLLSLRKGVDPAQQVAELLTAHSFPPAVARTLVECELTITPACGVTAFAELLHGRPGEGGEWVEASEESKATGAKVLTLFRRNPSVGRNPLNGA